MCTFSAIGDNWQNQFPNKWPAFQPNIYNAAEVSRAEFLALKREVEELRELLKAANKFDKATGQPHCEQEEKVKLIKQIAKMVGVDVSDLFPTEPPKPSP